MPAALKPGDAGTGYSALADFPFFSHLDADSLADMTSGLHQHRWAAGAQIFARGDEGEFLLAIRSGRVRLSLSSARGREIVLGTPGPGEILGEMALIDGEPRAADATAMEETTAFVLTRARFMDVAARRVGVGLALARHVSLRIRRTNFQMESIALYDLQTRLVRFLLYAIERLPKAPDAAKVRLTLGLSQGELAAILGASRPKVSLALQALAGTGALRREGEALVCDTAMLLRLSEGAEPES